MDGQRSIFSCQTFICLFVCWLSWTPCLVTGTWNQHYKVNKHYQALNGTLLRAVYRKDMTPLMCANLCTPQCWTATYSKTEDKCMTYKDLVYHSSLILVPNSDWNVLWKSDSLAGTMKHDNWTLVFRAQTGIKKSLYDVWMTNDLHNDRPVGHGISLDCLGLNFSSDCHNHFRSFVLDEWSDLKISQGIEKHHILFDAHGSSVQSWFDKGRVMSSSWDIKKLKNIYHFSIKGYDWKEHRRRFYIFGPHNGCAKDSGIFFVLDTSIDFCTGWQIKNIQSFPLFLYSPTEKEVKMIDAGYDYADVLAIFVSFSMF